MPRRHAIPPSPQPSARSSLRRLGPWAARALVLTMLLGGFVACGSARGGGGLESQLAFGVRMAERGLWSEALFRFRKAEDFAPNDFRVVNNLAVAYEANGLFDEALDAYQRALQIQPENRDLRRNYARFIEFYRSFRPEAASGEPPAASPGTDVPVTAEDG